MVRVGSELVHQLGPVDHRIDDVDAVGALDQGPDPGIAVLHPRMVTMIGWTLTQFPHDDVVSLDMT